MNIDIKIIRSQAKLILQKAQSYAVFIFIMSILIVYGFLILQIGILSSKEPDDEAVQQQLNSVKRLRIDQETIDKIQQLEDQNIAVQSLFKTARENPFNDE